MHARTSIPSHPSSAGFVRSSHFFGPGPGLAARSFALVSLTLTAALVFGCASTSGPTETFPGREEVAALGADELPASSVEPVFAPESYTLAGPLPAKIGDLAPNTGDPVTLAFTEKLASGATNTDGMNCAAREIAAVMLKSKRANPAAAPLMPGQLLRRHVFGACGNPDVDASIASYGGEVGPSDTVDTILANWRGQLEKFASQASPQAHVGASLVVQDGAAMMVFVQARRRVRLDPIGPALDGVVTIRGEILTEVETLNVLINQGLYGFAECEVDPQVRVPKFVARCRIAPGDEQAWVSVSAYPPKRFIGSTVALFMVRPQGGEPLDFKVHRYTASGPRPKDPKAFGDDFVNRLNVVRKKAGLGTLQNAAKQSATATRLSLHLHQAVEANDDERIERIMMGMLAGWDVDDPIVSGNVAMFSLNFEQAKTAQDMAEVIGAAMQWPGSRSALMDKEYDLLAIGPADVGDQELSVFLGSWDRFDGHSIEDDAARALKSLKAARRKGLTVPGVMPEVDEKTKELAKEIDAGDITAESAMDDLLEVAVQRYQHSMRAWTIYPRTLDDIGWPEELLENDTIYLSMSVAVEQHPSLAWSRKVVLIVAHVPNQGGLFAEQGGAPLPRSGVLAQGAERPESLRAE